MVDLRDGMECACRDAHRPHRGRDPSRSPLYNPRASLFCHSGAVLRSRSLVALGPFPFVSPSPRLTIVSSPIRRRAVVRVIDRLLALPPQVRQDKRFRVAVGSLFVEQYNNKVDIVSLDEGGCVPGGTDTLVHAPVPLHEDSVHPR